MPSFLHSGLLLLLLVLPFIVLGAILAYRQHGKAWKKMVAPRLQSQLVKTTSPTRRWLSLTLGLLGCALLIFSLARPYHGETTTTEQISTRNILIAIDTSRSMRVEDGSPDRMNTAKAMAIEVLEAFPNDRVGIIAFSGTALVMAPLTIDHSAVHETIGQLDTRVIPSGGSNLSATVGTALDTFKKTGQKSNALIIISDGEDHSQKIDLAATQIRDSQTVVCAIGVGKTKGGIIPDSNYRDGKFRDNQGRTVLSKMNPDTLDALARAGRGSFTPASSGSTAVISSALASLKRHDQESRETTVPNESFQWFLLPAIILLAASVILKSEFLAGNTSTTKQAPSQPPAIKASAVIILLTLCLTQILHSATTLEEAEASYTSGNFEKALELFTEALPNTKGEERRAIQFSIGSSAYKLKQWEQSNIHLSSALLTENPKLQEQVHYNLGNSLFMTGWSQFKPQDEQEPAADAKTTYTVEDLASAITSIEDSVSHFQASLDINPDNTKAAHNLDEAKKLLEQLKQKQQQQEKEEQENQQNSQQKNDQGDPQDNKEGQGQGDQPKPDPNAEPEDGNGKEKSDENNPQENSPDDSQDPNQNQGSQPKPENMERRDGETEEAHAARILKENSDAETRPVQRRTLRLRRPSKDW